jgi:negative regulator of flagellin synthesis FlgM
MKIGHTVPGRLSTVKSETRTPSKGNASGASSTDNSGQSVNLSDLSRTLSAMETQVSDSPVDTQRVASIKAAIANGDFKVDAGKVADNLVQSVQDLLGKNA